MVEGIVEVGQTVYIAAKRAAKPRSMSKAIRVYPICPESKPDVSSRHYLGSPKPTGRALIRKSATSYAEASRVITN